MKPSCPGATSLRWASKSRTSTWGSGCPPGRPAPGSRPTPCPLRPTPEAENTVQAHSVQPQRLCRTTWGRRAPTRSPSAAGQRSPTWMTCRSCAAGCCAPRPPSFSRRSRTMPRTCEVKVAHVTGRSAAPPSSSSARYSGSLLPPGRVTLSAAPEMRAGKASYSQAAQMFVVFRSMTSVELRPRRRAVLKLLCVSILWSHTTAFGSPVEPLVNQTAAGVSMVLVVCIADAATSIDGHRVPRCCHGEDSQDASGRIKKLWTPGGNKSCIATLQHTTTAGCRSLQYLSS
mmetsp:Transcript_56779/g.101987  ORF Transcript_56779/g.101987 Transcript_56779/m.101987 type:complete len:287 (+) Transcript_56779:1748-2608(+)